MTFKDRLTFSLCEIGQQPWFARVARHPRVQPILSRMPGGRHLYKAHWERLHPFDRLYGIHTSGTDKVDDDLADQSAYAHANSYASSQPSLLRVVLAGLPNAGASTFVDLGCGKGRPLFVATEFPFRAIIGVEFSPRLAAIAKANAAQMVRRHPRRTPVQILIADAGEFRYPSGDIVVFLYNSFGPVILRQVIGQLEAALAIEKRTVHVIYYNPVHAQCCHDSAALTHLYTRTIPYDPVEVGFAWGTEDTVAVWRSRMPQGS
jgi:SAM-dependent methyltransferase